MSFQITEITDIAFADEPVTLDEIKGYCGIDLDYAADDNSLKILATTARKRLERAINIGFVQRDIQLQWNGSRIELPLSPTGAITSVKDKDGNTLAADKYTKSGYTAASLFINSIAGGNLHFWYSLTGAVEVFSSVPDQYVGCPEDWIYTCVYKTGYAVLPLDLKQALLAEIDYLEKLKGFPPVNTISANAAMLCADLSRNLIIQ